jgi:beta-mannosidase
VHVANDGPAPVDARLRVALYRDNRRVAEGAIHIALPPHGAGTYGAEYILGRFTDAAYAYRFGPRGHDVAVASLYTDDYTAPFAQAFRFLERPFQRANTAIGAEAYAAEDGSVMVELTSPVLVWGVRVTAQGFAADDRYFALEPGVMRRVRLWPAAPEAVFTTAQVTAFNTESRMGVVVKRAAGEAAA